MQRHKHWGIWKNSIWWFDEQHNLCSVFLLIEAILQVRRSQQTWLHTHFFSWKHYICSKLRSIVHFFYTSWMWRYTIVMSFLSVSLGALCIFVPLQPELHTFQKVERIIIIFSVYHCLWFIHMRPWDQMTPNHPLSRFLLRDSVPQAASAKNVDVDVVVRGSLANQCNKLLKYVVLWMKCSHYCGNQLSQGQYREP